MKSAVLLMAHGTPASLDEMPEYLRLVRGGRPPSPELVAEMRHNYQAIGGRSPLTEITMAQGEALRRKLGADVPVNVGMRNWRHPRRRRPDGAAVLDAQRPEVRGRRDRGTSRRRASGCGPLVSFASAAARSLRRTR